MCRLLDISNKYILGCGLVLAMLVPLDSAAASGLKVLYTFGTIGTGDGDDPAAGLLADASGDFYGTALFGGDNCPDNSGCGAVFKLAPNGTETLLYNFCSQPNCADGNHSYAGLIADAEGNLYGTTALGGVGGSVDSGSGIVFKLAPNGTETVLYDFCSQPNCADGSGPVAGLIADAAGNLYGTTPAGGGCSGTAGVVFKLATDGTETVLHSFNCDGKDGASSAAGLIADKRGNLYGTTKYGGTGTNCNSGGIGCGTVFEVTPTGVETVLYSFLGDNDGANPLDGLIRDKAGNLYGTTSQGGNGGQCAAFGVTGGCGVVFKLAPNGTETVLYAFCNQPNCADGDMPVAGLVADKKGYLYGTTGLGGAHAAGIVFKLARDGTETVLYSLCSKADCADGGYSGAGLIAGKKGHLYGTAEGGGTNGGGTVFTLKE